VAAGRGCRLSEAARNGIFGAQAHAGGARKRVRNPPHSFPGKAE